MMSITAAGSQSLDKGACSSIRLSAFGQERPCGEKGPTPMSPSDGKFDGVAGAAQAQTLNVLGGHHAQGGPAELLNDDVQR